MSLESLAEKFSTLDPEQRSGVQLALCKYALEQWTRFISAQGDIEYTESVVGTSQRVDPQLPGDALAAAEHGKELRNVAERYQEPITALQDGDLTFPEHITFAYYALYNLFKKYALGQAVDDWLIVSQALSSEPEIDKWEALEKKLADEFSLLKRGQE